MEAIVLFGVSVAAYAAFTHPRGALMAGLVLVAAGFCVGWLGQVQHFKVVLAAATRAGR